MKPYPHQSAAIEAVQKAWEQFKRVLLVVPTGGGKTIIFSWLAHEEPGKVLILAHREELIDQAIDKLHKATGINADKEKSSDWASLDSRVVVASVQTLRGERLKRWAQDHFDLIIVDEAHHVLAQSYLSILNHFASARVLGVTATPDRGDKRNLGEVFEHVAYEIGLFDLIDDGYLAPITLKSLPLKIDLSQVSVSKGDFDEGELDCALSPYLSEIARQIAQVAAFRRVLAFLPLRATSHKFVDACRAAGLSARHVDGESQDRAEILSDFRDYKFDVLSNAMLLTEGYDDPGIDCLCVLRPTKSRSLFCQMIGRGTRTAQAKSNLLLLDPLWLHNKHDICRPAHLIAASKEEADSITEMAQTKGGESQEELDLQELATDAAKVREENLRRKLEEHKSKKAKVLTAEEFALQHNALDVAEYEPSMKWERDSVTEAQAKMLKRFRIDAATVRGKGHASKLISLIMREQRVVLASPKQQAMMRRLGAENWQSATAQEARKFFQQLRSK
jgi:superfamily II DNA or RNA helicase